MIDREIVVDDLVKSYPGKVMAVQGINIKVAAGSIYGFLGPNGAGKSTTIKILWLYQHRVAPPSVVLMWSLKPKMSGGLLA